MHLDSDSARSHAAEMAARRAAAYEQRAAEVGHAVEARAPRMIAKPQARAFQPGYAAAITIGRKPLARQNSTTDHVLAVHRPPDDWPVPTRVPRVPA